MSSTRHYDRSLYPAYLDENDKDSDHKGQGGAQGDFETKRPTGPILADLEQDTRYPNSYPPSVDSTFGVSAQEELMMALVPWALFSVACAALMLFYYFYRERALTQNHTEYQHVTNDDNRQPKKTKTVNRTQEAIENMLILKQVIVLDEATTKPRTDTTTSIIQHFLDYSDRRRQATKVEHRKCDLVIQPPRVSGDDDDLDHSQTCAICLSNYEHGDRICYSHNRQCIHRFHTNCAIAWFAKRDECPVCRADYLLESIPAEPDVSTHTLLNHSQAQEETQTPTPMSGSSFLSPSPVTIVQHEGDIESSSRSLTLQLGRNVTDSRLLETENEATDMTADDTDTSSHTLPKGDNVMEDAPGNRILSAVEHDAVCYISSVDSSGSFDSAISAPPPGSDNV